jgi:DNA modification methylase
MKQERTTNKSSKYINDSDNKSDAEYIKFLNSFTDNGMKHVQYSFVNIQMLSNNKKALIEYLHRYKDKIADVMVWDKQTAAPAMGENVLNSRFEFIFVFSEKATRAIGTKTFRGTLSNVVEVSKQHRNEYSDIHNATFPIELAAHFAKNFSSNSVLDLFGGTGTTLIACEQLNRTCYMMEYNTQYVDVIIERWEKYTGKKAELIKEAV